jgi:hypothetical protein
MATKIITKYAGGKLDVSNLAVGELAVNLADKKLYCKEPGGTVIELGAGAPSKILAESLLMGSIVGWDLRVAGKDLDFPDTLTWTKGGETIRAQIVWSAQKDVQRVVWQASTATGTMAAIGTYTVKYNTSQQIVGGVWS